MGGKNVLKNDIIFNVYITLLHVSFFADKNNVDIGLNISGELESLKKNLDKYKKSGMGEDFADVDVQTLDWVEDNRKVKAFFIYDSSL